jgi:hypothetical protein
MELYASAWKIGLNGITALDF